jgi:hypothetical protein
MRNNRSTPVSPGVQKACASVGWHQQEVALCDGDDPLSGQDVEAAFDDEEDLGRAGVVVGRWPVGVLAELAAGDAHGAAGGVTVDQQLDRGGGDAEDLGVVGTHQQRLGVACGGLCHGSSPGISSGR